MARNPVRALMPFLLGVSLAACGSESAPDFPMTANPAHASMFGAVDLDLQGDFSHLGVVRAVTVNGVLALDLRASAAHITARLQGSPASGPASITVTGDSGAVSNRSAFVYDAPAGGAPMKWAGFGASLTQGFESAGLSAHSETMGFGSQVANAAGAYLGPPLVIDSFVPELAPSAFVNDCNTTFDVSAVAGTILQSITDPTTSQIDYRRARLDSTLVTRNFAVGGAMLSDILAPATGAPNFIERVVELPDGDPLRLAAPLTMSQIDRLVALDPDVAVSLDLLANDSDSAVTGSDDLHPEAMTDVSTIQSELTTIASRLGALHGDYFISNLLELDALPNVADLRAQRIAAGTDTEQTFDAKVAAVSSEIDAYNAALVAAAAPYPNLHVIDMRTWSATIIRDGITVGGEELTGKKFGGLLSLDHLHFTDTGYALAANAFIDAINAAKGWKIPSIDVTAVHAQDALSPSALAQAGVHCGM
ncbi:MAG: SGNH/GDSL hydrolase family protein [Polyangiaceae bacterium]